MWAPSRPDSGMTEAGTLRIFTYLFLATARIYRAHSENIMRVTSREVTSVISAHGLLKCPQNYRRVSRCLFAKNGWRTGFSSRKRVPHCW